MTHYWSDIFSMYILENSGQYLTWEGEYTLSIPLTTPLPQCSIGRAKLQCAAAVKYQLGSLGKLLIHKWAMKSDMGWDYALLTYHQKKR